jgi:hypothetical protein
MLESMEGERHHLQQTVLLAPQDDKELQSEQPLAEKTLFYLGPLKNCGSH